MPTHKNIALVAPRHFKPGGRLLKMGQREQRRKTTKALPLCNGHDGFSLLSKETGLAIKSMISGPMGGDQQLWMRLSLREQNRYDDFLLGSIECRTTRPGRKHCFVSQVFGTSVATNRYRPTIYFNSSLLEEEVVIEIPNYEAYLAERT